MRHVLLTCLNHPDQRWQCKEIAVNSIGQYNGSRNIFFLGTNGVKHFEGQFECTCPPTDLRFAPEEIERQKTEPLDKE